MVGLRWWNHVDSEGKSHWIYEARKVSTKVKLLSHTIEIFLLQEGDLRKVHPAESRVFWTTLIAFPVAWVILFILALFRFSFRWLVLDCIALSLNGANLYGYLRCKLGKGTNLTGAASSYANGFFRKQVINNVSLPIKPSF